MVDDYGIKVIRTLWGNSEHLKNEIYTASRFENEVVMVYGKENYNFLADLGYKCILVSDDDLTSVESYDYLYYKIHSLVEASKYYEKILFLDWDVKIVKPVDQFFWDDLIIRKFSFPTYGWNSNFEDLLEESDDEQKVWLQSFIDLFPKYSWDFNGGVVIPNACFIYLSNRQLASKLLDICNKHKLKGLIDELSLFILANCTFDEFIRDFEPSTIFASGDNSDTVLHGRPVTLQKPINDYIRQIVDKDIYLTHH